MRWRHWIGILISVVCLWWALRGVSWHAVWAALQTARLGLLAVGCVGAVAVGVFVRALRWRLFLPPAARVSADDLVTATGIGLMANNVLPARMGEFVRAYVMGRRARVGVTAALGSLFVERLFDAAALTLTLVGAVLLRDVPPWMEVLARIAGAVLFALLAFEVLLVVMPGRLYDVLRAVTAPFLPRRWEEQVEGALRRFIEAFQVLRDPRRMLPAVLLTLLFWGANGLLFYLALVAFGLESVGYDGALIVQSVTALGISVPASPGFVGTFQAFIVKTLTAFGVEKDLAFSYSIAFHATQYLPVTLFGMFLAWRANLSWREIEKSEERVEDQLAREPEPPVPPGIAAP